SLNYTRKQRNSIEYIQPSPPVVYDVNGAGNAGNNNNSELVALRAELERLKNQVNERDQRNAGANLLNRGTEVDTAKTTITAVDSSRVNSLRTELDMIRNQLDSLRSSKQPQPVVTPASVIEKFDPGSFPVISVYFKTGAVILSGDQLNRLTPFAQVANKNAGTQILLKGFTDPVGNPAANRVLAVKRTEYVRNYLVNRHRIATSRIVVDEPASTAGGDKKPNPLDRRVDLKFER
ncbi:MAG: OmpA family protein, partial [Chitinophagaceae bacterium]